MKNFIVLTDEIVFWDMDREEALEVYAQEKAKMCIPGEEVYFGRFDKWKRAVVTTSVEEFVSAEQD